MKARAHPNLILVPVYLSVFVTALGIGLVAPLIPVLISRTGADNSMVGMTASVMFASFVITSWPLGKAIDRWGIRPFLLGGLACYGVAMAFMPWADSLGTFFLLRILEGIGWAGVWISTETYISWVSSKEHRGRNMGFYSIAQAVGTTSGPVVGYGLNNLRPGLPFFFAVVLTLVVIGMVATLVSEPQHDHEHDQDHHPPLLLSLVPSLALPLTLAAIYGFGLSSLVSLLPLARADRGEVTLMITLSVIASIIAQLPIGKLTDRYGARPVLLGSLSILVPATVVASFGPPFPILLAMGVILGSLAGTLYPIGLTLLGSRVSTRQLGLANGLFSLSYGGGSVLGPTITGWAMDNWGPNALFASIGVLNAALLASLVLGLDSAKRTTTKIAE